MGNQIIYSPTRLEAITLFHRMRRKYPLFYEMSDNHFLFSI
jgi:hypothetical protein